MARYWSPVAIFDSMPVPTVDATNVLRRFILRDKVSVSDLMYPHPLSAPLNDELHSIRKITLNIPRIPLVRTNSFKLAFPVSTDVGP